MDGSEITVVLVTVGVVVVVGGGVVVVAGHNTLVFSI